MAQESQQPSWEENRKDFRIIVRGSEAIETQTESGVKDLAFVCDIRPFMKERILPNGKKAYAFEEVETEKLTETFFATQNPEMFGAIEEALAERHGTERKAKVRNEKGEMEDRIDFEVESLSRVGNAYEFEVPLYGVHQFNKKTKKYEPMTTMKRVNGELKKVPATSQRIVFFTTKNPFVELAKRRKLIEENGWFIKANSVASVADEDLDPTEK
jgi:hypothetical protein